MSESRARLERGGRVAVGEAELLARGRGHEAKQGNTMDETEGWWWSCVCVGGAGGRLEDILGQCKCFMLYADEPLLCVFGGMHSKLP